MVLDLETGRPVAGVEVSCFRQMPREELMEEGMRRQGFVRAAMPPPSGMADTVAGEADSPGMLGFFFPES